MGGHNMRKASEYQAHAKECRALARSMQRGQREQLLEVAATWDMLATDSTYLLSRHPELATAPNARRLTHPIPAGVQVS